MPDHFDLRSAEPVVLPVSALNRRVARLLEQSFPLTWIGGEISNFTRAASGHCYFSLKDATAQVRAVMFRRRAEAAAEWLRNGQKVEVLAGVSLYEARGDFQLNVETLRPAGQGDLNQRFLELRARLQAEGLFDEHTKRALPAMPRAIGVVTSLQAAALRDVLITLSRWRPRCRSSCTRHRCRAARRRR
ncbi:MAG: exodeoxyribonuclease VII large subunit [Burkholderiaceae bacterium]